MTETTKEEPASLSTYRRLWIFMLVVLILDQVSKWFIVSASGFPQGLYPPFGGQPIIPGWFNLVYAVNYGAAWGLLTGFSWLLIGLALLVLVLIAAFHQELSLQLPAPQICFGMISGGIVGNTVDRLLRGHVVDFLDVRLPGYQWPTFNIADSAIVIGTLFYIYLQLRHQKA